MTHRLSILFRLALLLTAGLAPLSCTEGGDTWIVVNVVSDADLGLNSVQMVVRSATASADGGSAAQGKTLTFADPSKVTWSLFPDGNVKDFAVEITARGMVRDSGEPVVEQRAMISFKEHVQKTITMTLSHDCLSAKVHCAVDLTCQLGHCVDPVEVGTPDGGAPDVPIAVLLPDAGADAPADAGDARRDGSAADADARPDAGPGDAGTKGLGVTCLVDAECGSLHCVDGLCCNEACIGSCQQCDTTAMPGQCVAIASGQPAPAKRAACVKDDVSTCKQTGVCDGKGKCQLYADGAICKAATCDPTANTLVESRCDGLGVCKAGTPLTCAPFRCKTGDTQCARTCTLAADCDGQPCLQNSCGKLKPGASCMTDDQCDPAFCVDGVCCNLRCAGQCQACNLSMTVGVCSNVKSGQPVGGRAACTGTGTCGGSCTGQADCTIPDTTVDCRAASCAVATLTAAAKCNGGGACPAVSSSTCGGHLRCQAGTALCLAQCATTADCTAGFYCANKVCVAVKAAGGPCAIGEECGSGLCADSVCCNSACNGSCQTCASTATPGTCTTVASADDVGTCSGTSTCSATGTCLKRVGQTCAVAGDCASGNCVDKTCCNSGCNLACQTCTTGTCSPVTNGDDADSCTNALTCNGQGACVSKVGQVCANGTECSSGLCVDQRCCNTACNLPCQTCVTGTCSPVNSADDAECTPTTTKTCNASGACVLKLGQACTTGMGTQCASGQCVDGHCCNTACNGPCQTCATGTCSPVNNADDPECTPTTTKTCNGAAACLLKQAQSCTLGSECATGQCFDNKCCNVACNGPCMSCATGTCLPVNGGDDPECTPTTTKTCNASGSCLLKLGQACPSGGTQCASGLCVDGVCCSTSCTESCKRCDLPTSPGTCSIVVNAEDNTCTGSSTCNASGVCTLKQGQACTPTGAPCVTGLCVDGRCCNSACTTACQSCNLAATPGTCSPVASGDDPECTPTASRTCNGGACLLKLGQACTTGTQCANGFCADGVCCSSACNGSCQVCNAAGTCGLVSSGQPVGGRAPCSGAGSTCGASCNGQSASCVFAASSIICRAASCSTDLTTATPATNCNGSGTCPAATTQVCTPTKCAGGACPAGCTDSSQCLAGAACVSGHCQACGGLTVCGNACADLSSDPLNCNICGHNCLGGSCSATGCQPARIAVLSPGNLTGLGMNSTTIFATAVSRNDGNPIFAYSVPKNAAGGSTAAPTQIASFPSTTCSTCSSNLALLGANDTTAAWQLVVGSQGGADTSFYACTPGNCNATNHAVFLDVFTSDSGYDPVNNRILVHESSNNEVKFVSPVGMATSLTSFVPPMFLPYGSGLTVFGGNIYDLGTDATTFPTAFGELAQVRADNNSATAVLATNGQLGALQVTTSAVFWIGGGTPSINRVPLPNGVGTGAIPLFQGAGTTTSNFTGNLMTADDAGVYWIDGTGRLLHCAPAGCGSGPALQVQAPNVWTMVMDGQAVYYISQTQDANFNTIASSIFRVVR